MSNRRHSAKYNREDNRYSERQVLEDFLAPEKTLYSKPSPHISNTGTLIVLTDEVPIEDLNSEYVTTRRHAFKIKDTIYDLALATNSKPVRDQNHYPIPVLSFETDNDMTIFPETVKQHRETGLPRFFVTTPANTLPYLIQPNLDGTFSYAEYHCLSYADFTIPNKTEQTLLEHMRKLAGGARA